MLLLLVSLLGGPITAEEVQAAIADAPQVRDAFDREMNDYPTARFRDVHITVNGTVEGHRGSYFCGKVNGKNRMGAYTGWQDFMASASNDGHGIIIIADSTFRGGLVATTCGADDPQDPIDRSALLTHR